jgi:hypothetical protein
VFEMQSSVSEHKSSTEIEFSHSDKLLIAKTEASSLTYKNKQLVSKEKAV